jgi:hypothetical protein
MGPINSSFLVGFALLMMLIFRRRGLSALADESARAIDELMDNFRGGPPTPMHPCPADDGALLRKRARKTSER